MASLAPTKAEVLQLLRAAEVGDVATILSLITKLDIDTRGPSDLPWLERTPLMIAAEYNRQDVVKMLLNKGADLNARDEWERTPLMIAAEYNRQDVVKMLLNKGADLNARDERGRSALSIALWEGNEELAGALITAGADIKITDNAGNTMLMCAAEGGCTKVASDLLNTGSIDINAVNKRGRSALSIALEEGNEELAGALITAGADIKITDIAGNTMLMCAAEGGCTKVASDLLNTGSIDINAVNKDGWSALTIAICDGNEELAGALITAGADIKITDNYGNTMLMCAAEGGCTKVASDLLNTGSIDINAVNEDGDSGLSRALWKGNEELAGALITAGADIKITDNNGNSLLHSAAQGNCSSVIGELVKAGLDVNIVNKYGRSALSIALYEGNEELAGALITAGADIKITDNVGDSLLHRAALGNCSSVIGELVKAGLDVNIVNKDGDSALSIALWEGNEELAGALITAGADIKITNNDGDSLLHNAAQGNCSSVIGELLVKAGLDVNIVNKAGETPLDIAIKCGNSSIVHWFVKYYNIDLSNYDEDTRQKISRLVKRKEEENLSESSDDDSNIKAAFALALKEGKAQSRDMQLLLVGAENTGKSCLVCSFLGEKFIEGQVATVGVEVDVCKIYCKNWMRIDHSEMTVHLRHQFICQLKKTAVRQQPPKLAEGPTIITRSRPGITPSNQNKFELPEPHPQDIQEATTNTMPYDPNTLNVTIWDFAGQVIFHNTHAVFISENGVIVITFDASMKLTDEIAPREGSPKPAECYTVISSIKYWLKVVDSICCVEGDERALSPFLPVALLAGTHIDKLHPDIKVARQIAKKTILPQLEKELTEKPYTRHLAGIRKGLEAALQEYCFFISNKCRDEEIAHLQSAAIEAATSLRKEQPISFLKIERSLLMQNDQVITKSKMLDIVTASTFPLAEDSSEFKGILEHFHSRRLLLYFSQVKSLKNIVVLSPRWLAKLFSYVITAHSYKVGVDHELDYSSKLLTEYGILHERLITYMVDKFHLDYPSITNVTKVQVVDILLCFHLVAEITREAWFAEKGYPSTPKSGKTFIVPSLVPRDNKKNGPNTTNDRTIYYFFPGRFVPTSVLNQLIANCICHNVKRNHQLLWMRHGKVALKLGTRQKYYISHCEEKHSIQLTITVVGNDVPSIQERRQLIDDVEKMLNDIMKVFMPAADQPVLLVPCPLCSILHITFTEVCAGGISYCSTNEEDIALRDHYHDLMLPLADSSSQLVPSSQCVHVPGEILAQKPKLKILNRVVIPKISAEWENVAHAMNYHLNTISAIKKESHNLQDGCQKLFKHWLTTSNDPSPKTWKTLLECIEDVEDLTAAVEEIKAELVKEINVPVSDKRKRETS
ncbi:uncharacterized protein [Dysidea avara]|uniref:uncharacterized protein isoform X4 n=1 Tax=Dysidea avara TaxID=196820 RepID=UPI0033179049